MICVPLVGPNESRGTKAIKDFRHVTKHFAETSWAAGRKFQLQKLTVFNFRISIKFQKLKKTKVSKAEIKS